MFGVENMLVRVSNEIVMANLHYLLLGVLLCHLVGHQLHEGV